MSAHDEPLAFQRRSDALEMSYCFCIVVAATYSMK